MNNAVVCHVDADFDIAEFSHSAWNQVSDLRIDRYWSGVTAPSGRHFTAKLLWSDTALYVRFQANQAEPLIVSDEPLLSAKTVGLWDRDVCEIFIAPEPADGNSYYEFEIAPTGEWLDLAIQITSEGRLTDWEYNSHMKAAAQINEGTVVMATMLPFSSLGAEPKMGDAWRANLFRCVGRGPDRGYLAWQPTFTDKPNFHVPAKFGRLVFE